MKRFMLVLAVMLIPAAALANIPSPENSTTPGCIRICPESDICQEIEVRDQNDNIMPNTAVRMIFSATCESMICWCQGQDHPVIELFTDANGMVTFCVDAGGCCVDGYPAPCDNDAAGANTVVIEADPAAVTLNSYDSVGSPDNYSIPDVGDPWGKGDCAVTLEDFVRFTSIFLTDCACADLHTDNIDGSCDEDVDLNDFVVFAQHFLHSCTPQ